MTEEELEKAALELLKVSAFDPPMLEHERKLLLLLIQRALIRGMKLGIDKMHKEYTEQL